ncbi:hypothetical protein MGE_02515 [Candida albicans P75010]|nr:hypothetical protein MGE_02515 [Candida albicans P75010]
MLFKNFLLLFIATATTVFASYDVSSSLIHYHDFNFNVGDIAIRNGASFSLVNTFDCLFKGDLTIEEKSKLYITSTGRALILHIAGLFNKVKNDGLLVVNTLESHAAAICKILGASFVNTGDAIFAFQGRFLPPIIALTARQWQNFGRMHFLQKFPSKSLAMLGHFGGTIENHGTLCFTNQIFKQLTTIDGRGCIALEKSSSFFIENSLFPIDRRQVIYMGEGNPSIQAVVTTFPQTFKVANFGGNGAHKIGLNLPLMYFPHHDEHDWFYDEETGILTLRATEFLSQNFDIGLGYDPSKFEVCSDESVGFLWVFNGAIKYNGPAPNPGRPSICQACPGIHSAPGAEPSTTTKSIITTKTDGAVCTEVDTVIVSSDKSGSWYTTTSGASINCGTTSEAPIPNPRVTITTTWTEITTATVTETGTKTDTVIVQVPTTPNPQITVTKTWTESFITASTVTGDKTDTVIVDIPETTTSCLTTTNTWTGDYITTITTSGWIIVEVPTQSVVTIVYTDSQSTSGKTTTTPVVTAETSATTGNDNTASTTDATGKTLTTVTSSNDNTTSTGDDSTTASTGNDNTDSTTTTATVNKNIDSTTNATDNTSEATTTGNDNTDSKTTASGTDSTITTGDNNSESTTTSTGNDDNDSTTVTTGDDYTTVTTDNDNTASTIVTTGNSDTTTLTDATGKDSTTTTDNGHDESTPVTTGDDNTATTGNDDTASTVSTGNDNSASKTGATDTENDTTSTGDDDTATTIPTDAPTTGDFVSSTETKYTKSKKTKTHKTKTYETELTKTSTSLEASASSSEYPFESTSDQICQCTPVTVTEYIPQSPIPKEVESTTQSTKSFASESSSLEPTVSVSLSKSESTTDITAETSHESTTEQKSETLDQSTSVVTPATNQESTTDTSSDNNVESTSVVTPATNQESTTDTSSDNNVESTTAGTPATNQESTTDTSNKNVESTSVVTPATNQESTTDTSSEKDVESSSQFATPSNPVHTSLSTEYYTTGVTSYYTSYVTVTAETTEVLTLTSCVDNHCHKTTATTGVTVVTLTTSDIQTVITTYAPLTQTVTLGIAGSKIVDLGCPIGNFGYKGYVGKGIKADDKGIDANAHAGFKIGFDAIKRDQKVANTTNVTVQSSKNAGAISSVYSSIELLCAVAAIMVLII